MLEQFQTTYTTQKWVKYSTWLGVLLASALLFWVSGGFPPQPWHFLIQTIALIPRLWIRNGPAILLPLAALILLSFTLLFFWLLLVTAIVWMVKEQRNYLLERQRFEASLQKAESLASQDLVYQQLWQEQTGSIPRVVPVNSQQRSSRQEQVFSPSPSPSPVATLDPLPPNWHE
ncbi:MAG TPA: hypothetical protein DHV65_20190, partial [Ktedonobacter sp.]|nr:hypothetical protein [Ktedonobacter sp.]